MRSRPGSLYSANSLGRLHTGEGKTRPECTALKKTTPPWNDPGRGQNGMVLGNASVCRKLKASLGRSCAFLCGRRRLLSVGPAGRNCCRSHAVTSRGSPRNQGCALHWFAHCPLGRRYQTVAAWMPGCTIQQMLFDRVTAEARFLAWQARQKCARSQNMI